MMLFVYMKCRFSLSYRELEEMMMIRGAEIDHSTLQRWVKRFVPLILYTLNYQAGWEKIFYEGGIKVFRPHSRIINRFCEYPGG